MDEKLQKQAKIFKILRILGCIWPGRGYKTWTNSVLRSYYDLNYETTSLLDGEKICLEIDVVA